MKNKPKKARRVIVKILLALCVLIFVWWFNNYTLRISETVIKSEKINDEIKIVQLSDLHGAVYGRGNKNLIAKVKKQQPDIICVTGDMYTTGRAEEVQTALSLLTELAKDYTVYFVNGEHDYAYQNTDFFDALRNAGVNVMNYKDETITVRNTSLHIYGISNVYYSDTFNLANAFKKDEQNFSVLLAHIPNFKKFAGFGADLSLCGDTHGGMFRLPYFGAVYDGKDFFPERKGKYIKGLYELDGSLMFISGGLGRYPAPVRFCNRPEISVIKLRPAN